MTWCVREVVREGGLGGVAGEEIVDQKCGFGAVSGVDDEAIESALAEFEHRNGRAPTDAELAEALGVSTEELERWLAEVASTTVGPLDRAVAAGFEPVAVDGDAEHTPTSAVEADEVRAGLRSAIRSLPERERLVLGLYYDEGLTLAEIGGVIGLTESRVSQLHTRSVLSLRSRMRSAGLV